MEYETEASLKVKCNELSNIIFFVHQRCKLIRKACKEVNLASRACKETVELTNEIKNIHEGIKEQILKYKSAPTVVSTPERVIKNTVQANHKNVPTSKNVHKQLKLAPKRASVAPTVNNPKRIKYNPDYPKPWRAAPPVFKKTSQPPPKPETSKLQKPVVVPAVRNSTFKRTAISSIPPRNSVGPRNLISVDGSVTRNLNGGAPRMSMATNMPAARGSMTHKPTTRFQDGQSVNRQLPRASMPTRPPTIPPRHAVQNKTFTIQGGVQRRTSILNVAQRQLNASIRRQSLQARNAPTTRATGRMSMPTSSLQNRRSLAPSERTTMAKQEAQNAAPPVQRPRNPTFCPVEMPPTTSRPSVPQQRQSLQSRPVVPLRNSLRSQGHNQRPSFSMRTPAVQNRPSPTPSIRNMAPDETVGTASTLSVMESYTDSSSLNVTINKISNPPRRVYSVPDSNPRQRRRISSEMPSKKAEPKVRTSLNPLSKITEH